MLLIGKFFWVQGIGLVSLYVLRYFYQICEYFVGGIYLWGVYLFIYGGIVFIYVEEIQGKDFYFVFSLQRVRIFWRQVFLGVLRVSVGVVCKVMFTRFQGYGRYYICIEQVDVRSKFYQGVYVCRYIRAFGVYRQIRIFICVWFEVLI